MAIPLLESQEQTQSLRTANYSEQQITFIKIPDFVKHFGIQKQTNLMHQLHNRNEPQIKLTCCREYQGLECEGDQATEKPGGRMTFGPLPSPIPPHIKTVLLLQSQIPKKEKKKKKKGGIREKIAWNKNLSRWFQRKERDRSCFTLRV